MYFLVLARLNQRPFAHFLTERVRPSAGKQKCRVLIEIQPDDNSATVSEVLSQGPRYSISFVLIVAKYHIGWHLTAPYRPSLTTSDIYGDLPHHYKVFETLKFDWK